MVHLAQTSSDKPMMFQVSKAEGIFLFDENGNRFIDLISGISVSNVGHRHPKVIAAIKDQCDKFLHTMVFGEHIQSPQVALAEKLCTLLPKKIDSVFFVNSGSEAVEGAMKLAKKYTERFEIVAATNAYHGSTQGALSLMDNQYYSQAFRPLLPGVSFINFNNIEGLEKINERTAAVIVETVQGEAGYIQATQEFLDFVRKKCDETGALLILDEIQSGFGRTGKFFAFEHYGIDSDIILTAKGMGGGMPIGAFSASNKIMRAISANPILGHITTFGGHPVSCAASLATIGVIEDEHLMDTIPEKERLFRDLLKHDKIKAITGKGLMLAIHLDFFDDVQLVIAHCLKKGLLTDWFLYANHCIRIAPPLTINMDEIRIVCVILLEALDELK